MRYLVLLVTLAVPVVVSAQRFLITSDAVDAASNASGIARGSVFVVKGSFPLPVGLRQSPLPLQETLNGVSVRLTPTAGGEPVRCWMLYTDADFSKGVLQVAAVLPSNTEPGEYKVSVLSGTALAEGGRATVVEHSIVASAMIRLAPAWLSSRTG